MCGQAKKEFVPLPAVEALLYSGAVPWSLAFTQRLGRHVVTSRDIQPGECGHQVTEKPPLASDLQLAIVPHLRQQHWPTAGLTPYSDCDSRFVKAVFKQLRICRRMARGFPD